MPVNKNKGYKSRHRPSRTDVIPCLRCDRDFRSWDTVRNRICPSCANYAQESRSSMDWETYTVDVRGEG